MTQAGRDELLALVPLAALIAPARFPYASRIGNAAGQEFDAAIDPQRAYEFGLHTILDGVESLIQQKNTHGTPDPATKQGSTGP